MNPDQGYEALKKIASDYHEFLQDSTRLSEADTRVKLVDRILREVLGWKEKMLSREDHSSGFNTGFTDYKLTLNGKPYIVVEAKKEGVAFELPVVTRRRLKISGSIESSASLKEAIEQARQYCVDDIIIDFAIVTNGHGWIIFKTSYKKEKWRDQQAVVFSSFDDLLKNYLKFYNLLSLDAITNGSLESEFESLSKVERKQYRVLGNLLNADEPLQRNRLHAQLFPVIDAFFLDIADKSEIDILKSCYVRSRSVKEASLDMESVINDEIPLFLKKEGAKHVLTGEKDSGHFDKELTGAIESNVGNLYILLGGIGSGKTTFTKRYLRLTGHDALESGAVWFYLSLLGPPTSPEELELEFYRKMLEELRLRYKAFIQENRRTVKKIFKDEIDLFHETTLKAENLKNDDYEKRLSPFLDELRQDIVVYTCKLLQECKKRGKAIIIFMDNIDQLPPDYQHKVFFLAQKITRDTGSLTVLSLREESYYTASSQKALTAYANKKFHIASPRFRKLIENRLDFASKMLMKSDEELRIILKSGIALDKASITGFLQILQKSIFSTSRRIPALVEAICQGNMRQALDMFNTFLVSGATDVGKMLNIHKRGDDYNVPFHEFLRAVMLGDRRYYKETSDNPIINIFDCGASKNSSHFTGLRLLNFLQAHRNEYHPEGRGFVEWVKIQYEFENVFDNLVDLNNTAIRLLRWKLIEVNTKSCDTFDGVTTVRTTSAGFYYLKKLVLEFSYLDLVLQDTPLDSYEVFQELAQYMKQVDNLTGKDDDKYDRMVVRLDRVKVFLEYLSSEENREVDAVENAPINPIFRNKFMPEIMGRLNNQRTKILGKLAHFEKVFQEEEAVAEEEIPGLLELYDEE